MQIVADFFDFLIHLDDHLVALIGQHGTLAYLILFLIIFSETGVVFLPFLPGDSLLFFIGIIAASNHLSLPLIIIILIIASILGNISNYFVGSYMGDKILATPKFWIKKEHVSVTKDFYQKYGPKAIVLGRFIPIARTFVPFIAGVIKMNFSHFMIYTVIGGILWVVSLTVAGYYFGNIPLVRDNITWVVLLLLLVPLLPLLTNIFKKNRS
ncbi:MAG: hypothetical protein K0S74_591 [Chlamydiales bacterium]|jgi:membrane-associated protein|nr:hypothetical protein [Chlamydiales bacterium]